MRADQRRTSSRSGAKHVPRARARRQKGQARDEFAIDFVTYYGINNESSIGAPSSGADGSGSLFRCPSPAGTRLHGAALLFRSQTDGSAAEILDLSRRALRRLQGVSAGTRACANDGRSSCIFPVVYRATLPEVQSPGVSRAPKRPLFHFGETNSPCCASATDRRDRSRGGRERYVASVSRSTSTAMRWASLAAGMPQYIATRRRMS